MSGQSLITLTFLTLTTNNIVQITATRKVLLYRVCHRFGLMKQVDYFFVNFDHF